jgi:hypothetical protein
MGLIPFYVSFVLSKYTFTFNMTFMNHHSVEIYFDKANVSDFFTNA